MMAEQSSNSCPRQAVEITASKILTAYLGIAQDLPAHICVFQMRIILLAGKKKTLLAGKYDYSIQSCHLMCFNTQSVLQHPEILYHWS